ncbi:hypothetical protein HJC23_004915 [Cyclotella cryptica]|uniref:Uncharacterized protein n=1 Tax=Cyclotella cryptica TaxID=29204 RepID=A0ABD3PSC3_9STRA|eukprot:CCRYP_011853-RA/>CCRYP_011853-RA protein AED:0.13 eAED:0.49 QI:0/0/0/1/0/0/3/0/136
MYPYAQATLKVILVGIVINEESSTGTKPKEASSSVLLTVGVFSFTNCPHLHPVMLLPYCFMVLINFQIFSKLKRWTELKSSYLIGFALHKIGCHGEDEKLTCEQSVGWQAHVLIDDGNGNYNKVIDIMDATWDRKV